MADGSLPTAGLLSGDIAAAMGRHKSVIEKRAAKESWPYTEETGRGGKRRRYDLGSLPADVQAAVLLAQRPAMHVATRTPKTGRDEAQIRTLWSRYEQVPQDMKDQAQRRLAALQAVNKLVQQGHGLQDARGAVAAQLQREGVRGGSVPSLCRWAAAVAGLEPQHWVAALVPNYTGGTATAEIPEEAWDTFKADYLRLECPTATSCYDRLQRTAKVRGWALPSLDTFERRIAKMPRGLRILAREGQEALMRTFPAQERDRSIFHALEAVNADGHKFDVFVRSPMGDIVRPMLVGVQDLYSGKILGWRIADTESSDLARMAFRDAISRYGIPSHAWLDNGRGFASKMLTGGVANRFRFKVREDDPTGVLVGMGIDIHWATPYHGQAKPIERAWRDFCDRIAKHPAFAGAYTGNKPDAKPENYGSKAVAWDDFVRVIEQEIAAHNARAKRRTRVCGGVHSFDDVFNASYAQSTIRKATDEQLRQLLMTAEVVSADRHDGSVRLSGNRYWCEALSDHAGRKVLVRFDPDALHTDVQVYTLANVYIGQADCIAAVGFADTSAAREHLRARKQYIRATKDQAKAEIRMDAAKVAAQLPADQAAATVPSPGVIAPVFGKAKRPAAPTSEPLQRTGTDDARDTNLASLLERLQQQQMKDRL
ncbi:MAG TPA: transposase domain-containing protein [Xanthomonadaceae bacterium]